MLLPVGVWQTKLHDSSLLLFQPNKYQPVKCPSQGSGSTIHLENGKLQWFSFLFCKHHSLMALFFSIIVSKTSNTVTVRPWECRLSSLNVGLINLTFCVFGREDMRRQRRHSLPLHDAHMMKLILLTCVASYMVIQWENIAMRTWLVMRKTNTWIYGANLRCFNGSCIPLSYWLVVEHAQKQNFTLNAAYFDTHGISILW